MSKRPVLVSQNSESVIARLIPIVSTTPSFQFRTWINDGTVYTAIPQTDNTVLVTWGDDGHTTYYKSQACRSILNNMWIVVE